MYIKFWVKYHNKNTITSTSTSAEVSTTVKIPATAPKIKNLIPTFILSFTLNNVPKLLIYDKTHEEMTGVLCRIFKRVKTNDFWKHTDFMWISHFQWFTCFEEQYDLVRFTSLSSLWFKMKLSQNSSLSLCITYNYSNWLVSGQVIFNFVFNRLKPSYRMKGFFLKIQKYCMNYP